MRREQPEQKTNRIQHPPVGWSAGQRTWKGGKVGVAGAPHPTHQGGAGDGGICVSAPAPEPHSGRAQVASASRWGILELGAWTGWWERPGASRPGAGVRAPQARLARCAEAQPPTAAHRLTRRPSLSTRTRSAREEPPPSGAAGVRWGSVLPRETLQKMETRRDESRRVPRTVRGASVKLPRAGRGRGGAHLLLYGAPGSGFSAPAPAAPPAVLALAARAPRSHARATQRSRAGWARGWEGHAPRRWPGTRSGLGAARVRAQPLAADSGGELGSGRAAPFASQAALRPPPSALCPLLRPSPCLPRSCPGFARTRRPPAARLSAPRLGLEQGLRG